MAEQNAQACAGVVRRQARRSVPKEISNVLEQHYQTNPYPSRFNYIFLARKVDSELDRIKNWFNKRRRADSKSGTLCRNCRYFRAPIDDSIHVSHVRLKPCYEYWKALDQAKAAENLVDDAPTALPDNSPPINANCSQPSPALPNEQQLSTYVNVSALLQFLEAWQRTCNESLPFYAHQQFLMQPSHNAAPMWMNLQHFPNAAYMQNAWNNQQQPTMNRNHQPEWIHFKNQTANLQHGWPINGSDLAAAATGTQANLDDHLN